MRIVVNVPALDYEDQRMIRVTSPDGIHFWMPKRYVEVQMRLDGQGLDIIMEEKYYHFKRMADHGFKPIPLESKQ